MQSGFLRLVFWKAGTPFASPCDRPLTSMTNKVRSSTVSAPHHSARILHQGRLITKLWAHDKVSEHVYMTMLVKSFTTWYGNLQHSPIYVYLEIVASLTILCDPVTCQLSHKTPALAVSLCAYLFGENSHFLQRMPWQLHQNRAASPKQNETTQTG